MLGLSFFSSVYYRGVFRALSKNYNETFLQKLTNFCQTLHHKGLAGC